MVEEEELEEFDDDLGLGLDEPVAGLDVPINGGEKVERPKAVPKKVEKAVKQELKAEEQIQEEIEMPQAQPQYVAVPRAVPVETMINELYDGQQEIKQILMAILEKIK